jgi:hypothetical protein
MRRLVVMMPNTLSRAFEAIDGLADDGALRPDDCAVLKAFYAAGWQDGFVTGGVAALSRALGVTETRLMASITALSKAQAVELRQSRSSDISVELLSLSRPWMAGDIALGWWRYHLVDDESDDIDGPIDGPSAA